MQHQFAFKSFFLGGFECSTHVLSCGRRLDVIASTRHDMHAVEDYERLKSVGIEAARDGISWHRIEFSPYRYDFSSVVPLVEASERTGMQVIWDLCHYGWPDGLDLLSVEFVDRFRSFAAAFANFLTYHISAEPYVCPINEISFFAWAAGEVGYLNPYLTQQGNRVKRQLVRAHIAGIEGVRSVIPAARIVQIDPVVNVLAEKGATKAEQLRAESHCESVFHAWEAVAGRRNAELGGRESYLDIVGVNYYPYNQFHLTGGPIDRVHPSYIPLHQLLGGLYRRLQRPLFIGETGIENEQRPEWLAYIADEVIKSFQAGVPVGGVCLYPIVNHPGWDDDRHCHNGLWDYCNDSGEREIYKPLADELQRQSLRIARAQHQFLNNREAANACA
ncbi:MAG: hypothetical protein WKF37_04635 [Bryobacteraceae bacterium]